MARPPAVPAPTAPARPWARERHRLDQGEDDLFEFSPAAAELARQVGFLLDQEREEAVIVSVEGPWGSGKSTFAEMVWQSWRRANPSEVEPVRVRFNAWLSTPEDGSAWPVLARRIGQELYTRLRGAAKAGKGSIDLQIRSPARTGRGAKPLRVSLDEVGDPRQHWTEVAWRLHQAVEAEDWHPCLTLFCDGDSRLSGRGLNTREGLSLLFHTVKAAARLKIEPMSVLTDLSGVVSTLGEAWRARAHRPDLMSDEAVALLDRLIESLHPGGARPRVWLEIEDISRLDERRLRGLLSSLAWLEGLRGVVVVLVLDREQADEVLLHGASGEGALVRSLHLRQRVPAVLPRHWVRLLERWAEDQGLDRERIGPLASELGDLWHRHGVVTPRHVKRGLVWMHQRLSAPEGPALADLTRPAVLALGAVWLRLEGLVDLGGLGQILGQIGPAGLVDLPRQLWSNRAWPDGLAAELGAAGPSEGTALLWRIRWVEVARGLGADRALIERLRTDVMASYAGWLEERAQVLWGELMQTAPEGVELPGEEEAQALAEALVQRLGAFPRPAVVEALRLSNAAWMEAGRDASPPEGLRALLGRWPERTAFEWAHRRWPPGAASLAEAIGRALSLRPEQAS